MRDHSGMRDIWQTRGLSFRESMLLALAICSVARGSDVFAAEPEPQFATPVVAPSLLPPSFVTAPTRLAPETFSLTEFRPRKRAPLEMNSASSTASFIDMPTIQDTSMAHQMSDFKSQNRLRLLTLWQSRSSSLYLQAGKRGAPSLQWSTPWMHRDAGSRGLFDHLLAISPRNTGATARSSVPRATGVMAPAKSFDAGPAAWPAKP